MKLGARRAPFLVGVAGALVLLRPGGARLVPSSADAAVVAALVGRGLSCSASDVTWIDRPRGFWATAMQSALALVRARAAGELDDLYLVRARLSPEGRVLAVQGVYDVTETSGADESLPSSRGHLVAYASTVDGWYTAVHVIDLSGHRAEARSLRERAQVALTNLQQTGLAGGVVRHSFRLNAPARHASVAWLDDGTLEIRADDRGGHGAHVIDVDPRDPRAPRVVRGGDFVHVVPDEGARPGSLVPWAVDRLRAEPWFGDRRMQWVKAVTFTLADHWRAMFSGPAAAQDMAEASGSDPSKGDAYGGESEVGWPPMPMKPVFRPGLSGEGLWTSLAGNPFVTPTSAGAAPSLVQSFVRPNPRRDDVIVYAALWDPRQIALHIEAGTLEPVGTTGEHGPGVVPRAPEVLRHLVAAFNGGFQTRHGEFGMRADGTEYLPPKPYGATVMELRDGSNAFGTWPDSPAVPSDVVSFRQNLTALVQDGQFNPWGRDDWGGAPPGWPDAIHVTRSALCLTREGFVGYFYSPAVSPQDLGAAMLAARCRFGVHLDMNWHHVGFELYDVAPVGGLPSLGRPLDRDWEAEGIVPDMSDLAFRARRLTRAMDHMLFPRYIGHEARDFFYLTSRDVLPGAPIAGLPAGSSEGVWRTAGLPQHGFPYAVAVAQVRANEAGAPPLRVIRVDPHVTRPAGAREPDDSTVIAIDPGKPGPRLLWWVGGAFSIGATAPVPGATPIAGGFPANAREVAAARAGVGVQDEDGMLALVELAPGELADVKTAAAIDAWLVRLGCSARMVLTGDARLFLRDSQGAEGDADAVAPPSAIRFVRARAPDAHLQFADTPLVPAEVWKARQAPR